MSNPSGVQANIGNLFFCLFTTNSRYCDTARNTIVNNILNTRNIVRILRWVIQYYDEFQSYQRRRYCCTSCSISYNIFVDIAIGYTAVIRNRFTRLLKAFKLKILKISFTDYRCITTALKTFRRSQSIRPSSPKITISMDYGPKIREKYVPFWLEYITPFKTTDHIPTMELAVTQDGLSNGEV